MHVNTLCLKLRRNENLLKQSRNFLPESSLKMLYYAQIYSHLTYGLSIWGPMISETLNHKLQKIQTSYLHHVFKVQHTWCKDHNVLNVNKLIKLELCKMGYKLINRLLPTPLLSSLRCDQNNKSLNKKHKYSTRNKAIPNHPKPTTKLYQLSFLCKSISAYQSFMVATKDCLNLKQYSACCKKILHDQ